MSRPVNLTKRVRTSKSLRFYPVVLSANGRLKPDCVLVGDRDERHTEGAYYLGVVRVWKARAPLTQAGTESSRWRKVARHFGPF